MKLQAYRPTCPGPVSQWSRPGALPGRDLETRGIDSVRVFDLTTAMIAGDWQWVAGWINGRFRVSVSAKWVGEIIAKKGESLVRSDRIEKDPVHIRLTSTWYMWWKNRLAELGLMPKTKGIEFFVPAGWSTTLHVFFIAIDEDEEMLERLRRPDVATRSGPQTPAIERVMTKPTPIDRVAAKVVPGNWEKSA